MDFLRAMPVCPRGKRHPVSHYLPPTIFVIIYTQYIFLKAIPKISKKSANIGSGAIIVNFTLLCNSPCKHTLFKNPESLLQMSNLTQKNVQNVIIYQNNCKYLYRKFWYVEAVDRGMVVASFWETYYKIFVSIKYQLCVIHKLFEPMPYNCKNIINIFIK